MSTLRVSNIEAKADVSSPSVHEKVKVTNSQGDVLIHIDGSTSGITTVGINTTGSSFDIDINQNVTFAGNVTVGGTLTYADVTNVDSIGFVTARSGLNVGTDSAILNFSDGGETKFIEIGATGGVSGGDALLITHSSGSGVGYFGYEAGGDRLVIATDDGSGTNKIDFITDAGIATGGGTDNLDGKVPKMRILHDGKIGIGTDAPTELITVGAAITTALFEVKPVAGGFDINVSSGDFHPHYQNNFAIYNGQPGSGQQRLKLSPEGYLTVPNQPAFFAHGVGGDVTVNNGNKFAFNATRFNRGNHYDTTNYRFLAPVAGVYCFQVQVWAKNGSTNSRARFYKNNASRSQNGFHAGTVNNAVDHTFEMSILEDMQVGDTMDVRAVDANLTYYAGNANEVHTYFTGFLVA
mgnify:CR=1 FL=1|tara:strand:- start:274 stop:1497 length:1224 start_codon:yes stop_codon:yes gene_type:complete